MAEALPDLYIAFSVSVITGKNFPMVSSKLNLPSSTNVITMAALSHLLQLAILSLVLMVKSCIISSASLPCLLAMNLPIHFLPATQLIFSFAVYQFPIFINY